jgi:5-formyltetrahydrofolate cyclo-ligase
VAPGAIVAGYWSFRGELDISPALISMLQHGFSMCLPVIEAADKPLYFRRWRQDEPLEMGRYGIGIPPAGAPVFKPDVLLVPLVAFDRNGHRLGYGAGYYDRTLRRIREEKQVLAIGVGYSEQEVPHIPAGLLDEKLDMIITQREVIRISR